MLFIEPSSSKLIMQSQVVSRLDLQRNCSDIAVASGTGLTHALACSLAHWSFSQAGVSPHYLNSSLLQTSLKPTPPAVAHLSRVPPYPPLPAAAAESNLRSAAIRAFQKSSALVGLHTKASTRVRGRDVRTSDLFPAGQGGANLNEAVALPDLPALDSIHPIHWPLTIRDPCGKGAGPAFCIFGYRTQEAIWIMRD
jgi:hypothetical protein